MYVELIPRLQTNYSKKASLREFFQSFQSFVNFFDKQNLSYFDVMVKVEQTEAFESHLLAKNQKYARETNCQINVIFFALNKRQVEHLEMLLLKLVPAQLLMNSNCINFVQCKFHSWLKGYF